MINKICIVGLGYVGLPLAVEFAKKFKVVGFDKKQHRIEELQNGIDRTREVDTEELKSVSIEFTADPAQIGQCEFIIVAVPTPVTDSKIPDLTPLISASKTIGQNMSRGSIIVYESTVYPGATEEDCVPVLENASGLKCGVDFKVGYSPERVNPGDRQHRITQITKVVSGMDAASLKVVSSVYGSIITAGIFEAASIKVAEAAKVIENTQRDLNIALMNELALIFDKMGIRTADVLAAAGTKWNFLKFSPGLVGGHCIGVDPYYLTHKALSLGYHPAMILAGRGINDNMGREIVTKVIRLLVHAHKRLTSSKILILGFSFKENIPDTRNTKVIDLVHEFKDWGCQVDVYDPVADQEEAHEEYEIEFISTPRAGSYDAVVMAVMHQCFIAEGPQYIMQWLKSDEEGVFVDIKSCFHQNDFPETVKYWCL
ncbi:MAG: nucleotide sugar dehydrogenase [SAR324 cluster bacterium]|nr:nucleotide sugar dehydrogenase [SAR324 cluster bacterium]